MRVLFWLYMGLDVHSTSGHLIMSMIRQVLNKGNDVTVISKNTGGNDYKYIEELKKLGVHFYSVKLKKTSKSNFAMRYLAELKYTHDSSKIIKKGYFDSVFIQSNIAAGFSVRNVLKRCPNARITYNVQDVYPQDVMYAGKIGKNNPAYRIMSFIQSYAYKRSDVVITISEDMKDLIVSNGSSSEKTIVIYNWSYHDELFDMNDISPKISNLFDNNYFNIVYAGNIGLFQNVDVVIDVAERMKGESEFWFHIFGSGIYKEKLEYRTKELGIENITFHPIQPHELAPSIYASASVNLIPLGENQYKAALPSKTATCLACQKPIVFIIGTHSKFGKRIKSETNCPVLDFNDVDGVVNSIREIKNGSISINTKQFYYDNCSITKNSLLYAEIILGEKDKI